MGEATTAPMEMELESGVDVALVGGGVAIVTGAVTGLWQWLNNRKKLSIDAQASLVSGFVSLLTSVQNERDRLLDRITKLETENHKQDRRIGKLERVLRRNHIEIPDGHDAEPG